MPLFRSSPSGQLVDSGEFIPAGSSNRQIPAWVEQNTNWQPTALTAILPGAPLYDVLNFGAVGDGIADDTAALNAAIAAANAVPGAIYLASRHRITAPLTPWLTTTVRTPEEAISISISAERRRSASCVSPPGGQKPSGSARQAASAFG